MIIIQALLFPTGSCVLYWLHQFGHPEPIFRIQVSVLDPRGDRAEGVCPIEVALSPQSPRLLQDPRCGGILHYVGDGAILYGCCGHVLPPLYST